MKWTATLLLTTVFALGSTVFAEDQPKKEKKPKPTAADKFAKLDTDENGSLSEDEFFGTKREKMKKKYEGKEGGEEMLQKAETKMKAQFAKKDQDQDGSISLDEYAPAKKVKKEKPAKKEKEPAGDPADRF